MFSTDFIFRQQENLVDHQKSQAGYRPLRNKILFYITIPSLNNFRPYSCPCPGASCKWQGSLEQVMSHLMQVHKSITTLQGEDIVFLATDINLPGAVDWVMMQSCFGHHFM